MTDKREQIGLTCIRGFAALWVVTYHFSGHFGGALNNPFVQRGHLGVDLFFVLSGFILAYVYLEQIRFGRFDYRSFLIKRLARIYPVHAVTMVVAFVILAGGVAAGLSDVDMGSEARALVTTALLLHSYGILDKLYLNYPSWSISAEFFAYLLFPWGAAGLLRVRYPLVLPVVLLAACVVGARFVLGVELFELTTFSLPRILPEFLLGIALFRCCERRKIDRRGFWMGMLVLPVVALGPDWAVVLGFAALIALLYMGNAHLGRSGLGPLIHLGHISYSIYMVHGLIEMVGFKLIERAMGYDNVPTIFLPLMLGVTIIAGHVLYVAVEVPGQRIVLRLFAKRRPMA